MKTNKEKNLNRNTNKNIDKKKNSNIEKIKIDKKKTSNNNEICRCLLKMQAAVLFIIDNKAFQC